MYTNLWQILHLFLLVGVPEVESVNKKVKYFKGLDTHCQTAWQKDRINLYNSMDQDFNRQKWEGIGFLAERKF